MATRDWQAAVAGGPSWECKQIIIPTVRVRVRVGDEIRATAIVIVTVRVKVRMRSMELNCRGFGDDTFGQQSGCSRLFTTESIFRNRKRKYSCLGNQIKEEEEVRHFSLACGTSVTLGLGCGCIMGVGSGVYGELLDDVDDEMLASLFSGITAPAPSTRALAVPVGVHVYLYYYLRVWLTK